MPNPQTDRERSTRYLRAVLRLNPIVDGERIVGLRAKYLRIEQPKYAGSSVDHADERELRQRMTARLEDVRRDFWKSDIGKVQKGLDQLQLDSFPDLRLARQRLLTLAAHRHEFGQLAEKGIDDAPFFRSLRTVLVSAPGIAATERDELIESIKSPARLKAIRSMIQMIRKQMPAIYALEADWLETISRMRKRKVKKAASSGGSDDDDDDDIGVFGLLVLFAIISALRMAYQWGWGE